MITIVEVDGSTVNLELDAIILGYWASEETRPCGHSSHDAARFGRLQGHDHNSCCFASARGKAIAIAQVQGDSIAQLLCCDPSTHSLIQTDCCLPCAHKSRHPPIKLSKK